ncbi:MAG: hypothetical protein KKE98_05305 [Nanoarchaeota archaeon]|nr:hypothetical protein [Nanoarchaeota archaeon]MBU1597835.1 hypothetical protein [Nanoarchaeota archaeon]MBU2441088.1 hypothetical protein [Nanoarchaeota archaeon]
MQMTESIFVVFMVLIIIVIGFVVYSKFQETSIKEKQKLLRSMQLIEMGHRLSSWPELECSVAGVTEFVCLDTVKLMVLGDIINKTKGTKLYEYYFDLLKNSKITVTEIYPSNTLTKGKDYWVLYENPGMTKTIDPITVPVNLYNPLTKQYAFGVLELLIYE